MDVLYTMHLQHCGLCSAVIVSWLSRSVAVFELCACPITILFDLDLYLAVNRWEKTCMCLANWKVWTWKCTRMWCFLECLSR
jgi:hypothetical protein